MILFFAIYEIHLWCIYNRYKLSHPFSTCPTHKGQDICMIFLWLPKVFDRFDLSKCDYGEIFVVCKAGQFRVDWNFLRWFITCGLNQNDVQDNNKTMITFRSYVYFIQNLTIFYLANFFESTNEKCIKFAKFCLKMPFIQKNSSAENIFSDEKNIVAFE